MKLIFAVIALAAAHPLHATDILLSEDGTILKLENTEDALAPSTPLIKKLPVVIESEEDESSSDSETRACEQSSHPNPTS